MYMPEVVAMIVDNFLDGKMSWEKSLSVEEGAYVWKLLSMDFADEGGKTIAITCIEKYPQNYQKLKNQLGRTD